MELLFEIKTRTNPQPSLLNGNSYEFFDNSSWDKVEKIRNLLNEWYLKFPSKGKKDLKGRFLKSFNSAFFELFVYTLFRKKGFTIEIHPNLKHSSSQPDFLIRKDDLEFYVEAKVVIGESERTIANNRIVNTLCDEINKNRFPNFTLSIKSAELKSSLQPSSTQIIKSLNEFHSKIEEELQQKEFKYIDKDISLKIKFLRNENYNAVSRPIAIYPSKSWWGSGETNLQKKIIDKSKKYKQLDKPFFLFVNTLDNKSWNKSDIESAVLGSEYLFDKNRDIAVDFKSHEMIFNKSKSMKKVNGLFISRVFPNNIPNANYWFYKNNNSNLPFDFNSLDFKYYKIEDKMVTREFGSNINEILDLPKDWLD